MGEGGHDPVRKHHGKALRPWSGVARGHHMSLFSQSLELKSTDKRETFIVSSGVCVSVCERDSERLDAKLEDDPDFGARKYWNRQEWTRRLSQLSPQAVAVDRGRGQWDRALAARKGKYAGLGGGLGMTGWKQLEDGQV